MEQGHLSKVVYLDCSDAFRAIRCGLTVILPPRGMGDG